MNLRLNTSLGYALIAIAINWPAHSSQITVTDAFRGGGYAVPTNGTNYSDTLYNFLSQSYRATHKVDHAGLDIDNADGRDVYSIDAGVVVRVSPAGTPAENSLVAIRHTTKDGVEFTAIYGHTKPNTDMVAGSIVRRGQALGTTLKFGSPSHLHFGINTDRDFCDTKSCKAGWGRLELGKVGTFVNPETWLLANRSSIFSAVEIDGVGSLVDPANGGSCAERSNLGCSVDQVMLHRHSTPSAAIFQIFRQASVCEQVELVGLSESIISVRSFSDTYPTTSQSVRSTVYSAFGSPSTSGNPVRIPLMGAFWQIISISTKIPLPESNRLIQLSCVPGTYSQVRNATLLEIAPPDQFRNSDPEIVMMPIAKGKGFAGGVGSLLPHTNNLNAAANGFGKNKDLVAIQSNRTSKIYLQILPRASLFGTECKNIRITSSNDKREDTGYKSNRLNISKKIWNANSWGDSTQLTTPALISLPSQTWWIISISTRNMSDPFIRVNCE